MLIHFLFVTSVGRRGGDFDRRVSWQFAHLPGITARSFVSLKVDHRSRVAFSESGIVVDSASEMSSGELSDSAITRFSAEFTRRCVVAEEDHATNTFVRERVFLFSKL